MKKRTLPKNKTGDKIRREKDPIPWRYCLLTLICGVFLVGGFFLAARSHFASIDFGIKNSSLKKQLEDLEAEKRRLMYLKEIALSPPEIKKAAKKLGLTEMTANSFANVVSSNDSANSDVMVEKIHAVKKPEEKSKQLIEKTVEQKPVEKVGKDGNSKSVPTNATAKKESKDKSTTQIAKK